MYVHFLFLMIFVFAEDGNRYNRKLSFQGLSQSKTNYGSLKCEYKHLRFAQIVHRNDLNVCC